MGSAGKPRRSDSNGVACLGSLAEFLQLGSEPVAQRAFRTQFFDQGLGLGEDILVKNGVGKQLAPGSRHFLFSQQFFTFTVRLASPLQPHSF